MQAKLDELLHAVSRANNAMTRIDEEDQPSLFVFRAALMAVLS